MRQSKYFHLGLLMLVLLIGVLVRVGKFPALPPGLNQDEASSAYESYSLAETGKDRWGNTLPVYFPGWGSGQNVLLSYLTVPVVKTFGLTIFTARAVSLGLGLLTLPLLFFCLRPLGRFPALLGTFLLAVVPWHFMLSRWALESNLVPFFMLLGCTTLSQALITQRRRWIIPSLLPFAVCLYAYGTTALVLPFLLGILLLLSFHQLKAQRGSWLWALGIFMLVATPFLLFFTENYLAKRNFAWTDSLFFATPLLPSTRISQVTSGHWTNTVWQNLSFMASGFDDGTSYNVLAGFKPLLSFTLPLAIIGLFIGGWKFIKRRGKALYSAHNIVLVIFAAWGLASLTLFLSFDLNVNRFNHFYLPCIVLAVWAIDNTINSFKPNVPKRVIQLGVVGWLALEGGLAIQKYFTTYAQGPIKTDFNDGLQQAFVVASQLWGIDQVRITEQMPLPYVYALFYLRYPPLQFQREAKFSIENGTYKVKRFGKYVFFDDELSPRRMYGYLSRKDEFPDTAERHRTVVYTNDAWEVGIMSPITH
jgi:predicted membrane-bound mannosyltransferase